MKSTERLRRNGVAFLILLFMYLNLAWAIQAAKWSEWLHVLQLVVAFSVCIGFLLAISRWPSFVAHVYTIVVGSIFLVLVMAAQLSPELSWADRVMELFLRLGRWIGVLLSNGVNYDNLAFVVQLAIYLWLFGYVSAWGLFRKEKAWWGIVPCGIGMLLNAYYAPPRLLGYFVIYIFLALLLLVQLNLRQRKIEWSKAKVNYAPDIGFDFLRDGLILGILVVILSTTLPITPTVNAISRLGDRMERPWRDFQDEWNRLFGSLTSYSTRQGEQFDRSMLLSGPVELGDTLIVDVHASQGRYWRAVSYDFYTGRGWLSTYEEMGALGKNASPISPPTYRLRKQLNQLIYVHVPSTHTIIAAPQLLNVDIDADAMLYYMPRDGATEARPPADIQAAYSRLRMRDGDTYEVVSSVSVADTQSLRAAENGEYPIWILQRYLQIPENLPRRVRLLAAEITRGEGTHYDKALAIERYLRQLTYNQSIEAPPPGWDAIDYFLFESREGYCDYYASAMVVLARSAGIPAKLSRGYSQGEKLEDVDIFRVREYNGHAWPELYFPEYGWVEFEPTASEPLIDRPTTPQSASTMDGYLDYPGLDEMWWHMDRFGPEDDIFGDFAGNYSTSDELPAKLLQAGRIMGMILFGGLILLGLGWATSQAIMPRKLTPARKAYYLMTRASRLFIGLAEDERNTPYEYAGTLAQQVPSAGGPIRDVSHIYVREQYSRSLSLYEGERAMESWKLIAPAFLRHFGRRMGQRVTHRPRGWWMSLQRLLGRGRRRIDGN